MVTAAYLTCAGIPACQSSCPEHADDDMLLLQRSVVLDENIGAPAQLSSHEEDSIAAAPPRDLEDEIASLEQDINAFEKKTQSVKAPSSSADVSLARAPAHTWASNSIAPREDLRARAQASHNTEERELHDQGEEGDLQALLTLQQRQLQHLDQSLRERALLSLQQQRQHLDEALQEQERQLNLLRVEELAQDLERLQGSQVGRGSPATGNSTNASTDESATGSIWTRIHDWVSTHTVIVGVAGAVSASICVVFLAAACGCSVSDVFFLGFAFGAPN